MGTPATQTRILRQPGHDYLVHFSFIPVTWNQEQPDLPAYDQPTLGTPVDITAYVQDYDIKRSIQQLSATLSLTLRADMDSMLLRSMQKSDAIQVTGYLRANGETDVVPLGIFLIDVVQPREDMTASGSWLVECRDVSKLLTRRRYKGTIQPSLIEMAPDFNFVTLTMVPASNSEYFSFYDTSGPRGRTWNWAPLPKPIFRVASSYQLLTPDGQNMVVLLGNGEVRIGTSWFLDAVGSNQVIEAHYYRYALWEDEWTTPGVDLNTPADVIKKMGMWAGFRETHSDRISYIDTVEEAFAPTQASYVIDELGANRTSDAAGEGSGIDLAPGSILYVGFSTRVFPAIEAFLSAASVHPSSQSPAVSYAYWDGGAWVDVTPDMDTTNDFRQSGIASWFEQDLSAWVLGEYSTGVGSAYWLRISVGVGAADFAATTTYLYTGMPITVEPKRIDSTMNLKPNDILDQHVRSVVPPNYRWYTDVNGNLKAGHDFMQSASPAYIADDRTRIDLTPSVPHDDDITTLILYPGQAQERYNAALAANGGRITDLAMTDAPPPGYFGFLIDGDLINWRDLRGAIPAAWSPPQPLFQIDLAIGSSVSVDEFIAHSLAGLSELTLTPGTAGVTWYDTTAGNSLTDSDDGTYIRLYNTPLWYHYQATAYPTTHQRVAFSTPQEINKLVLRLSQDPEGVSGPSVNVLVRYGTTSTDGYFKVASVAPTSTSPADYTLDNLSLSGVYEIMLICSSVRCQYQVPPPPGTPLCYRMRAYSGTETLLTGDWSLVGGTGSADALHDAVTTTGTGPVFSKLQEGWSCLLSAPDTVDNIHVWAAIHGECIIEWRADGATTWSLGIVLTGGTAKERIYSGLNWVDCVEIRMRVTGLRTLLELSEIEVFTSQQILDAAVASLWRIEYQSVGDPTWITLCDAADGFSFGHPRWTVDKSAFGPELYISSLRFSLLTWGQNADGSLIVPLAEVCVWMGDTIWGKAVLGLTAPYNTAADKLRQARLGWKSELLPVDVTAGTQEVADYRALQVLEQRLRDAAQQHLTDVRLDAYLGATVEIPSWIVEMYELVYSCYIVTELVLKGSDGSGPTTELLMSG